MRTPSPVVLDAAEKRLISHWQHEQIAANSLVYSKFGVSSDETRLYEALIWMTVNYDRFQKHSRDPSDVDSHVSFMISLLIEYGILSIDPRTFAVRIHPRVMQWVTIHNV